jgi:hypothetical protein
LSLALEGPSGDCTRERRMFYQGQPGRPGPMGFCAFHHDVGLGSPNTSSNVLDVLEAVVCQVARVAGS